MTCLRPALVFNALTVHFIFSSFLVVARRYYHYRRDPQKISRRVAREVLELSEYDLEIHHIKGTSNGRADTLSRRPDYDQGEDDNKNITVPFQTICSYVQNKYRSWKARNKYKNSQCRT